MIHDLRSPRFRLLLKILRGRMPLRWWAWYLRVEFWEFREFRERRLRAVPGDARWKLEFLADQRYAERRLGKQGALDRAARRFNAQLHHWIRSQEAR